MLTPPLARAHTSSRRIADVLVLGASASLLGVALTDGAATAASFSVTTTADGGPGSLRDAIDQANANPGPDTITVPAGLYTMTIAGANEGSNATGDFDITEDLTIVGAGAGVTIIDADGLDRVFDVIDGLGTFQNLTVTSGSAPGAAGGNILGRPGADVTVQDSVISSGNALSGGGIAADQGTLTIDRTEIVNNTGTSTPGNGSAGDAISKGSSVNSALVITDSLIADNFDLSGNVGAVYSTSPTTITNTTITGNSGYSRTLAFEASGSSTVAVALTHVTVSGNSGVGNAPPLGIYANASGSSTLTVTVEGSLLTDNLVLGSPANCSTSGQGASIVSAGHNLTDDLTCTGFTDPTDVTNDNATTLGALADNGGPTRTRALLAGSSAIDAAGACGGATPADQRGITRPQGPACDIGAFEVAVVVPPSTDSSTTSTTTTTTTTTTVDPSTSVTAAPTTSNGSGGVGATTLPLPPTTLAHGTLPATGARQGNGLWLAMLTCSLGGLLIVAARRRLTT